MDTQKAIEQLTILSQNLGATISQSQETQAAVDLAISQLQGTLTVQLDELEATKATLNEMQATVDASPMEAAPAIRE